MLALMHRISVPYLYASWGRTLLVVGGIATGMTLIVAIDLINTSVLANLRRTIAAVAGPAALEVTLGVGEVGFGADVLPMVRADPDVAAAVPLVRGTVGLAARPHEALSLFGADLTAEEDLARYRVSAATERRSLLRILDDPGGILVPVELAAELGIALGGSFALVGPTGIETVTVRGLLETEGPAKAFGGRMAVMDLAAAQRLLAKDHRIDQIDVVLREGADGEAVADRLRDVLPSSLSVARPAQRGAHYERFFRSFRAMLTGLSLLCLVAGVYLIYNTTSTAAVHRAASVARMRVVGASARQVFRLFLVEAAVLGVVGTLLGVAAGVGLARILVGMVGRSMGVIYQLRVPTQELVLTGRDLFLLCAIGIGASLVASSFAARRIARMLPLDVLCASAFAPELHPIPRFLPFIWAGLVVMAGVALWLEVALQSIGWGNFGSTVWNASVFVIAVPVVVWSAEALSRLFPRLFGAPGLMAAQGLFATPTRTGVTVAAVALVLTLGITVTSLSHSFHASVASYYDENGLLGGDLVVSAVTTEGGWLETPLASDVVAELRGLEGVARVETLRLLFGQVYEDRRIALIVLSDGFFQEARFRPYWYFEGEAESAIPALRAGTGVHIGPAIAEHFALHVGDTMTLASPSGPVSVDVVGITRDYVADGGAVTMSRDLFASRWRDDAVSRINVFLEDGVTPAMMRERIAMAIGDRHRLKILTLPEVIAYHGAAIDDAFAFTDAIQLLVIIVTIAGILDLLLAAITERRRELALWRLMGAGRRAVRRAVVLESLTIGLMGSGLGILVGVVTAWIWVAINFRYLLGFYLEFSFAAADALWYVALVTAMAAAAGYTAASRATREPVLDGLRHD